jgi:hypothetical protein
MVSYHQEPRPLAESSKMVYQGQIPVLAAVPTEALHYVPVLAVSGTTRHLHGTVHGTVRH